MVTTTSAPERPAPVMVTCLRVSLKTTLPTTGTRVPKLAKLEGISTLLAVVTVTTAMIGPGASSGKATTNWADSLAKTAIEVLLGWKVTALEAPEKPTPEMVRWAVPALITRSEVGVTQGVIRATSAEWV